MANNYTVNATQLEANKNVLIRGKLSYSRLTRPIEGQELVSTNQRRAQNGMNPIDRPHFTVSLTHAEVVFADSANPTLEETFVSERRYASKKYPESGPNYSIDSKGTNRPIIAIPSTTVPGSVEQDTSNRELAAGLDVILVLRVYKPKNYEQRGLNLEQVIVTETPRYYSGGPGGDLDQLKKLGIVFAAPPVTLPAAEGSEVAEVPDYENQGVTMPGPVPATAVAAQAAPVAQAAPATQAAPFAPVAQAAPVAKEESMEEKFARLERENEMLRGGASPVGPNPWAGSAQTALPGITYQG